MKKIAAMLIAGIFAAAPAVGATVIWDAFEQRENYFYYYGGPTPEIGFTVETFHDKCIFATADLPINAGNPRAYWVSASKGDAVDDAYLFSYPRREVLDAYYTDPTEIRGHTVAPMRGSTFYLALIVDDATYYGWLSIDVDGDGALHLAHSALSTEPGIVVGAIPEPSSALLLVLGCAALALKRRIRRPPALR